MFASLQPYALPLLAGVAVLVVCLTLWLLVLHSRVGQLRRSLRSVLTGPGGENLEELMQRCRRESLESLHVARDAQEFQQELKLQVMNCVQHVGLVRYDAFNDASGKQSFSLALLNANHHGVVVTSLFGRQDSRCYGKSVVNGKSDLPLTDEESEAIQIALSLGISLPAPERERGRGRRR